MYLISNWFFMGHFSTIFWKNNDEKCFVRMIRIVFSNSSIDLYIIATLMDYGDLSNSPFFYTAHVYIHCHRIVWYRDRIVSKQIMTSNANLEREDLVPFSNALTNLIAVHMLYLWSSVKMKIYRSKESKLEPVWDTIKRFRTRSFHWLIWIIQMWFVIRLYSSLYCYDP